MTTQANVTIVNKSPMILEIGSHTFDYGTHEVTVKNPAFFSSYINTLNLHGLTAAIKEIPPAPQPELAASKATTQKNASKGE